MTTTATTRHRWVIVLAVLGALLALTGSVWNVSRLMSTNENSSSSSSHTVVLHNSENERPLFLLHIGPPKTATTTIQESLTAYNDTLYKKDNFLYTGVYLTNEKSSMVVQPPLPVNERFKDPDCQRSMYEVRTSTASSTSNTNATVAALQQLPCVQALLQALEPYRQRNTSLMLSDETLGFRKVLYHGTALDYESLALLLTNNGWKVKVVIGYRYYNDWLVSALQQVERWRPIKPGLNLWLRDGGKKPTVPIKVWKRITPGVRKMPYYFTHQLLEHVQTAKSRDWSVQLFNLEAIPHGHTVRSWFVCHVLEAAHHTCQMIKEADAQQTNEVRANTAQTVFYDLLVVGAEERNMIDTNVHNRHDVVLQAKAYHAANNATHRDFKLSCPRPNEYRAFLDHSLALEGRIFVETAHPSRHTRRFWKAVEDKKYCSIHVEATLREPFWKAFFANRSSTT